MIITKRNKITRRRLRKITKQGLLKITKQGLIKITKRSRAKNKMPMVKIIILHFWNSFNETNIF
jgi:hypothetical protein